VGTVMTDLPRHFSDSAALRRFVKETFGKRVLLAFSGGKDAISAWLALRDDGFEVVPYFMYCIPGISFVDESIDHYERHFGTTITRVPHPSLVRMLRNLVFQAPENCEVIEQSALVEYSYDDVSEYMRQRTGVTGYEATGVRTADSLIRRAAASKHGTINHKRKTFWPVYDWRIADVEREIVKSGCGLSVEYEMFGRSFDGIDARFLGPLRKRFPADYQRVLDWFPLADLDLYRRGEL
jgi:hypothetical protein